MASLRFRLALVGAKLAYRALRAAGRNGSHTPGRVALAICPDYLAQIRKPALVVCVTGTNGKTTVTNLIADVLVGAGQRVSTNRLGSNIAPGIAAVLTEAVSWRGRPRVDAGVLEVDERASRRVLPQVKPDYLVVTNLFRDSLKRNAYPDFILDLIKAHVPAGTRLILNADDLCSSQIGQAEPAQAVYFGIDRLPDDATEPVNIVTDQADCPHCGTELTYHFRRYHHIGQAVCGHCGFASPQADYAVSAIDYANRTLTVARSGVSQVYPLISDTMFNIYNEVTAIAALAQIGLASERIAAVLATWTVVDSRLKRTKLGRIDLVRAMSKGQSSVSCSQTLDFVRHQPGRKAVVLLMDDWYDRQHSVEFIGWIYDADFEFLNDPEIVQVVAAGPRRYDYEVRLLLAGVAASRIVTCEDESQAGGAIATEAVDSVYLLYDTSTLHLADKLAQAMAGHTEAAVVA